MIPFLGDCDSINFPDPTCVNCTASMGVACELACIHGEEDPPFSQLCVCHTCYGGGSCDVECSHQGACVNDTCQCEDGYQGELCEQPKVCY